ncbi:replication initiation protein (plasmid) [Hymenobacter sp. BRD128]|uniref:replication initiation protein n=1 Tax=Hymenobacter sp. BRD128 TaxID=2675878 RepID=UPI0015673D9D|nr:replication initiation protein [Hymenobacter sp. BRD128]QKG59146.1 replication initiation protein [Hymenobacter sp. BRD128]
MPPTRRPAPTLPLTLAYEPRHRELVKQHWNVTFARQGKMSVAAKRIMARVLDQIRDDDFHLREYYQLAIGDITESAGINRENAYREIEGSLRELAAAAWEFKSLETNEWYLLNLLDTTKDIRVGYAGGTITVLLNPQLAPYFLQLAHYTTYRLDSYLKLRSWYSMRLYEILAAFRDTGVWEVGLEEYRQLLDCWHQVDKRGRVVKDKEGQAKLKYPNVNDLISNTTTEPLTELADTELAFRVIPRHEAARAGRGRKRIVGLRFELLHPQPTTIPAHWLTHAVTGPIIEKLRSWKVSDKNIALYATTLERAGIQKLLQEWQLKQVSSRAIDSPEKYCNAAFVRAAKQLIEQQKAEALQVRQDLQLGLFGGASSEGAGSK